MSDSGKRPEVAKSPPRDFLALMLDERTKQQRKYTRDHDDRNLGTDWMLILNKIMGEIADDLFHYGIEMDYGMHHDTVALDLVKLATVLQAWFEAIDRQRPTGVNFGWTRMVISSTAPRGIIMLIPDDEHSRSVLTEEEFALQDRLLSSGQIDEDEYPRAMEVLAKSGGTMVQFDTKGDDLIQSDWRRDD